MKETYSGGGSREVSQRRSETGRVRNQPFKDQEEVHSREKKAQEEKLRGGGKHGVFLGTGRRPAWLDYKKGMEGLIKTGLEREVRTRPDGSCRPW